MAGLARGTSREYQSVQVGARGSSDYDEPSFYSQLNDDYMDDADMSRLYEKPTLSHQGLFHSIGAINNALEASQMSSSPDTSADTRELVQSVVRSSLTQIKKS
mmetsp:Transcript_6612/g.11145  ORF Transcript_6612/g.11145 Transcript_6612/m.11145 type:complete len:103 (+) Transcript_6612:48-356(+)